MDDECPQSVADDDWIEYIRRQEHILVPDIHTWRSLWWTDEQLPELANNDTNTDCIHATANQEQHHVESGATSPATQPLSDTEVEDNHVQLVRNGLASLKRMKFPVANVAIPSGPADDQLYNDVSDHQRELQEQQPESQEQQSTVRTPVISQYHTKLAIFEMNVVANGAEHPESSVVAGRRGYEQRERRADLPETPRSPPSAKARSSKRSRTSSDETTTASSGDFSLPSDAASSMTVFSTLSKARSETITDEEGRIYIKITLPGETKGVKPRVEYHCAADSCLDKREKSNADHCATESSKDAKKKTKKNQKKKKKKEKEKNAYHSFTKHWKNVHQKGLICGIWIDGGECPHRETWEDKMERHRRSCHSNERPYECPYCDHRDSREDNLRRHLLTCRGVGNGLEEEEGE